MKPIRAIVHTIRDVYRTLKTERFFRIVGVTICILLLASIAIYVLEYGTARSMGLWDSFWWSLVTITTVGYGDIVPKTVYGRLIAFGIMISGLVLVSMMTATIASVFVTRKIKEGKGLEDIKDRDHIVICGWNDSGLLVVQGIYNQLAPSAPLIVLVNNLPREEVDSIIYRFPDIKFKYVRGNFSDEKILTRANIGRAKSAIILADLSGDNTADQADQLTIFGCMAIKSLAPRLKTCAELLFHENRDHLNRAGVDEVFVRGDHGAAILANAATSTGLSTVMKRLFDIEEENKLWHVEVPERFWGEDAKSLGAFYQDKFNGLVLAIVTEKKPIVLEDILSHDATAIDDFIKRKFEESGKNFFAAKNELTVQINPASDLILNKGDAAIILCRQRPAEQSFLEKSLGVVAGRKTE